MMEVDSIKIRRSGGEDDPNAEVVLEVQNWHGEWREVGREKLNGNFSHCYVLPVSWVEGERARCPECGYTVDDAKLHMDHNRCKMHPFFNWEK